MTVPVATADVCAVPVVHFLRHALHRLGVRVHWGGCVLDHPESPTAISISGYPQPRAVGAYDDAFAVDLLDTVTVGRLALAGPVEQVDAGARDDGLRQHRVHRRLVLDRARLAFLVLPQAERARLVESHRERQRAAVPKETEAERRAREDRRAHVAPVARPALVLVIRAIVLHRREQVDPALREAGWGVIEGSKILREYRITAGRIEGRGRRGKADIADYVLVYRNTKLAVVEAKEHGDGVVARAQEVADRDTAEALRGAGLVGELEGGEALLELVEDLFALQRSLFSHPISIAEIEPGRYAGILDGAA